MQKMTVAQQVDLLMQGTEYGDEGLRAAMAEELAERLTRAEAEGRPLRVYCGFDPRTSDLHIGHTVPIRKLRQFQELGHEVIFVIGRFTSLIGDPSDKDQLRPLITPEEATENAETYAQQAFKILDPEKTRIEYNDTWLSKLSFLQVIKLAENFTIQQFLTRENFRNRYEEGDPIYLHETFYSLMQGYDATHLETDVQVGGSDQLFNIVTAARKIMAAHDAKPNIGIILGILPGTDGELKMSKSLGNHIALNTTAEDMYGKVMSIPDEAMGSYFRLVTRWTPDRIDEIEERMDVGKISPRDVKMTLAHEVVAVYHGEQAAEGAEAEFRRVFQEGKRPDEMPSFFVEDGASILDVLNDSGLASSKSEARRLISQNGVKLEDEVVEDPTLEISIGEPKVLQVGKRRFVRLVQDKDKPK